MDQPKDWCVWKAEEQPYAPVKAGGWAAEKQLCEEGPGSPDG